MRGTFRVAHLLMALALMSTSLAVAAPRPARAADEPRDAPVGLLQGTGETRVVFDQTGAQVWAVVDGWDLDQYLYRNASPLDFAIDVDHDFGPVDANGHPAPGNALFGLTGRISLRVFDVDDDAPTNPEVDEVYINGFLLGTLTGANEQWSVNTFEFPLTHLLLPTAANPDGRNAFQVHIDTTNAGWAVEVAWAELRLKEDFVPLALIHGFTSSGAGMAQFQQYVDQNTTLEAGDIVAPTHSSANLGSGAGEIATPIDNLQLATGGYHVNAIAHSYGGLVARLYAWDHPTRVNKLILIGTPNGGSELADAACLFKNSNGPWAGILWAAELFDDQLGDCHGPENALFQMQTDYVRNVFNVQVPDRNGTEYWTISGVFGDEGRLFDFFPGADDGWVTLASSQYLSIGIPEHPGKHRLLGTIPLEHGAMILDGSEAMPLSVCELYDAQCGVPGAPQSVATSGTNDLVLGRFGGVQVPAGASRSIPLQFEGASNASVVLVSDRLDTIAPTMPGATFAPAKLLEANVLAAELASPVDGQLQITNSGAETASVMALVGVPAGRSLEVQVADSLSDIGSPVDVSLSLTEAGAGEPVAAEVLAPSGAAIPVNLTESTPGTWTGAISPTESGVHSVTAWVDGARPRFDSTVFTVSGGQAELTGGFSERLDGAEDGLADALVISPGVTVTVAGSYRLTAQLADTSGAVFASAGTVADLPLGTSSVDLSFAGRSIFDSASNGPYRIVDVVLSRDDAGLSLEDEVDNMGQTVAYDHAGFDHFPVAFDLDGFSDEAVDIDSDGVDDELRVSGSVTVDSGGTYAVNARLLAPDRTELVEFQTTVTMTAGENPISLVFDGEPIGAAGQDGPYLVADLSVYAISNVDLAGYLVTAHETAPYTAAQFGGSGPWPPSVRINNDTGAQTQQERPAVVVAPDGSVYAIWDDMRNGNQTDVYFSRRDPVTGTWGPNQKVNNDTTTRAQYRAAIAVDGSNNAYAVWHDQREGNQSGDANIYFAKRPAGTGTWGANLRVNNDTKGASQTAPRIAVTSAGEAVAVWVDRRSSQWNIYSSRLPAGSSTWGANLRVTDNTSSRKDAPDVSIAPDGTVYAVWEDDRSGNWDIYWSKLTPGSSTWTANARLSDDPGTFAQYSAAIGIDAAGNVLAAWLDDRAPNTEIRARRLAAGSGTWGPSQVASDGAADLPSDLALGVAPSGDALAVWADGRGTNWDIWGAEYNSASQQWSVSRQISDDPGTSHQMRPAVAVRGNVSVAAWFDARESYFGDIRATTR